MTQMNYWNGQDWVPVFSGTVQVDAATTDQVSLTNPTGSFRNLNPPSNLVTQEDANKFFAQMLDQRSPVVVLSQSDYDALSPDPNTLYLIT